MCSKDKPKNLEERIRLLEAEKRQLKKDIIGLRNVMDSKAKLSDISFIRKELSELTETYDHVLLVTVLDIFDKRVSNAK